ncbi:MAG: ABC transporter ATP-binding protein [Kiritimatiellae bacterium]|nr:ABC transporter ATP-binding protein [Kiritimatiellia bacterium]
MSFLQLRAARKVFPDGTEAVRGIDLAVEKGELVVLLGPSGCGKTTTLRMVAGLETPTAGRILMGGEDVTALRPAKRDIGFIFQFYALYPHMTVRGNLSFPLENTGVRRGERERLVRETAEQMGITHLLDRHPAHLSGGDQQKVSVARAMIRHPRLWLMDEPLGTIDAAKRMELREWIRQKHLAMKVTTLYVTHDQEEAMSLGDRVVVMNEGRVEQIGVPLAVYDRPASLFTADFIGSPGMNLLPGEVAAETGQTVFRPHDSDARIPLAHGGTPGAAVLGIRGEFVRPDPAGPLAGTVVLDEYLGASRSVHLELGGGARLVMRADTRQSFAQGERIRVQLHPDHVRIFDPESGRRRDNGDST